MAMRVLSAIGKIVKGVGFGVTLGTGYSLAVDHIRTGFNIAKWKTLTSVWGKPKIAEVLESILSADKDNLSGLSARGIIDTIYTFIDRTLELALAVDEAIASQLFIQMIQQSVAYAISNSHAGAVGTICNIYSGSSGVHPLQAETVGRILDLADRALKAFLSASAGLNIPTTAFMIQQGANQRIAEVFQQLQNQISRLINDYNDEQLEHFRHYIQMARNRFQDALELYENEISRAYTLIEQTIREYMSRVSEQLDTLEGARAWYDAGLISEDELREIAIRINLEVEASRQNFEEVVEEIESLIEEKTQEWKAYLNVAWLNLQQAQDRYFYAITSAIYLMFEDIFAIVNEIVKEVEKMVEDVCAYRNVERTVKFETTDTLFEFEHSPEVGISVLGMRRWRSIPNYTVVMEYQMPPPKLWRYVEVGEYKPKPYDELPLREMVNLEYPEVIYHYEIPSLKGWVFVK